MLVTIVHNALIVNKVSTERIIGEKDNDRKFQALGKSFKYKLFIKEDSHKEEIHKVKYNLIRKVINYCSSLLNAAKKMTWNFIQEIIRT